MRAPPNVISSCTTPSAATSPGAPPASATSRAASSAMNEPRRLSIERETTRSLRSSTRLAGDHRDVADAHELARLVAVLGADVDVQVAQLGDLLALLLAQQVDRLAARDARHDAVARRDLHALADEDLRVPAADAHEAQEAVVVDVRDDQADLVDVADDREEGRAVRSVPLTRATAEPMTSISTSSVKRRPASAKTAAGADS